jgi:hypothetical protein
MRLKFEKLPQEFIPGTAKGEQIEPSVDGNDVDLAMIVERLRNVPKPLQSMAFAETVDSTRQAGDPEYKKPANSPRVQPDDDFDTRYGLKPSTFGMRQLND